MFNHLELNNYILSVHLGVTDVERKFVRPVKVTLKIYYKQLPKGATSDQLLDVDCYADLLFSLQQFCSEREFHLLEKMALDCFNFLDKLIKFEHFLELQVSKFVPITNLENATFCIDNLPYESRHQVTEERN